MTGGAALLKLFAANIQHGFARSLLLADGQVVSPTISITAKLVNFHLAAAAR